MTLGAARSFARRLDRNATSRGVPEALVGFLTALAADSPEISSALVALARGAHGASFGVVMGSNLFNLAAMIGVSAVLVGTVRLRREALAMEGLVGLLALAAAAAVLLSVLAPIVALLLMAVVLGVYLVLLVRGPEVLSARGRDRAVLDRLRRALSEREPPRHRPPAEVQPNRLVALSFGLDVALIVAGSVGMVQASLTLGARSNVSGTMIGVLVLGPLTSLPNAVTGIRLGLAGRGSALVSETFNSNTINLVAGVVAPAAFVGLGSLSPIERIDLVWLAAATATCIALLTPARGMTRSGGAAVVLSYVGFVAVQLALR